MGLKDGMPCNAKGCLRHIKHPCEGCGRNRGFSSKPARLNFSLAVNCPNCNEEIDLTAGDHESMYITPIFNNKWDDLKGESVFCGVCGTEFQLSGVEY